MTTMLRALTLTNAAWREAIRIRHPEVDLDHYLLALIAAGGPAAELLGRHGVTLAGARRAALGARRESVASLGIDPSTLSDPAPLPLNDLHTGAAGSAPLADRVTAVTSRLARTWSENDLLIALVEEPSDTCAAVLRACGVDLAALVEEARNAPRTEAGGPQACSPLPDLTSPVAGTRTSAVRMTHMISAPVEAVRRAATAPELAAQWLGIEPADLILGNDGIVRRVAHRKGRRTEHVWTKVVDELDRDGIRIAWSETLHAPGNRWDGAQGSTRNLHLRSVPGGTLIEFTLGIRTFGRLALPASWLASVTVPMGLSHTLHALSFVTADLESGDLSTP